MATPDLHRGMEINSKEIEYASAIQIMVLYNWRRTKPIKLSLLDDQLCVMAQKGENEFYFMPPIGDGDISKTAELLFSYAEKEGFKPSIQRVNESMAETLKSYGFSAELDINNSDYVYLADDLATLAGRKFDGKRNRIKKCISENNPEYRPMTLILLIFVLNFKRRGVI